MDIVISRDGTPIAFERTGQGPAVILVGGAMSVRAFDPLNGPLAELLADRYTVYRYDRRGRGDSGDTPPYAVEREIEDLDALLTHAGGTAHLYGISSGAVLALRAAAALPGVATVAAYEPPFIVDDSHQPRPADFIDRVRRAVAEGRPGDAVVDFMTFVGAPEEMVAGLPEMPFWPLMESVAHTLVYDYTVLGEDQRGEPLSRRPWESVTVPVLVADGEVTEKFLHAGADALAEVLPDARRQTLPGQHHAVEPEAMAPVLRAFFGA